MPAEIQLIAPCGMNCSICYAHLRAKKQCPGCRGDDTYKMPSCGKCTIKSCETIKTNSSGFCYECEDYPCKQLKRLDKSYRTKYSMSMIENLENIRKIGISAFTDNENERWRCKKCGGVINVHSGYCSDCGEVA